MGIYGVGYLGIQNQYIPREIKQVDVEEVKKQDLQKIDAAGLEGDISSSASSAEVDRRRAERVASLEDISLTFDQNNEFDSIGRDSDLATLDMQKAISDMKKDSILQEYQYFVGSSGLDGGGMPGGIQTASEDGIVFQKF